jgi:hypothetical protein
MKIQEMKSGISHLTKRMETDRRDNLLELRPPAEPFAARVPARDEPRTHEKRSAACDLDEAQWAVVSFSQTEAGGLTYRQAAALLTELELNDIAGLCIVTDEAAKRIRR